MAGEPKKYGLILKNKGSVADTKPKAGIFDDVDDDVGFQPQKSKTSETAGKIRRQDKSEIAKALKEDRSVYQYDEIYDKLQKAKDDFVGKSATKEKDRKPKYIANLLKATKLREQEYEARVERQQLKEREKEGETFADKEVFVTKAYREKMEKIREYEEEERKKERIEGMMDVTKQANIAGFYRHLLNDNLVNKPVEIKLEDTEPTTSLNEAVKEEPPSKNIYDSDSDSAEAQKPPAEEPIKPGLRIVKKEEKSPQLARADASRRSRSGSSASRERSSHKIRRDRSSDRHKRRRKSSSRSSSGGRHQRRRSPRQNSNRRRDSPKHREVGHRHRRDQPQRRSVSRSPRRDRSDRHKDDRRRRKETSRSPGRNGHRRRVSSDRTDRRRRVSKSPAKTETQLKETKTKSIVVEPEIKQEPIETPEQKRLRRLQEIFARRNSAEQIEEFRQRYLARKAAKEAGLYA